MIIHGSQKCFFLSMVLVKRVHVCSGRSTPGYLQDRSPELLTLILFASSFHVFMRMQTLQVDSSGLLTWAYLGNQFHYGLTRASYYRAALRQDIASMFSSMNDCLLPFLFFFISLVTEVRGHVRWCVCMCLSHFVTRVSFLFWLRPSYQVLGGH